MEEDIRNAKVHLKVTQITEENALLREEIAKLDDRNTILERQEKHFKRQLYVLYVIFHLIVLLLLLFEIR